jgi:hypothetical protein
LGVLILRSCPFLCLHKRIPQAWPLVAGAGSGTRSTWATAAVATMNKSKKPSKILMIQNLSILSQSRMIKWTGMMYCSSMSPQVHGQAQ